MPENVVPWSLAFMLKQTIPVSTWMLWAGIELICESWATKSSPVVLTIFAIGF